jgi:hypothetical protein
MKISRFSFGAALLGVVGAMPVVAGLAGSAAAEPANTACPAGFETITVAQAVSEGYATSPVVVDNAGNGDGVVCRRALGGPPGSVQVYFWQDNATPRNV